MDAKIEKNKTSFSIGRLRTFDSFKIHNFRVYFASAVFSYLANSILAIANTLLLYRLTGSAFIVGASALAGYIPQVLLSLFGGAVADRIQKKYVLIASRVGLTAIYLVVGIALTSGYLSQEHSGSWWLLMFAVAINGIFNNLMQPAMVAIIPELVGRDRLTNGISLNNMGSAFFMGIGTILAGFLIDTHGFSLVYYLLVMLSAISAVLTAFLPRGSTNIRANRSTMSEMVEGLKYIRRETIFLFIIIFALGHIIGSSAYIQLTPVFTESILKVSATKLGLLSCVSCFASFLCSITIASLNIKKRGLLIIISGLIASLAIIAFSYSQWWSLSLVMVSIIGIGTSMHAVLTASVVQTYAEPDYRARMIGLVYMGMGLGGFAAFFAGALSEVIGLQLAVAGMAGILFVVTLVFLAFAKRLRSLE